jgi:hypothetical protein
MFVSLNELFVFSQKKIWLISIVISCIIIVLSFLSQQMKFGVSYPLGWDQPVYVHHANRILDMGLVTWIQSVRVLDLYWALPAYLGALINNVKTAVIIIEITQAVILTVLFSFLTYKITNSYYMASATVLLYPFLNNSVQLFVLPRESFANILILAMIIWIPQLFKPLKIKNPKTWFFTIALLTLFLWNITNAAFVVMLFSLICLITRNKNLIFNCLILFSISIVTTFSMSYAIFGGYNFAVGYWTPTLPSYSFLNSEFIRWTGGSLLLTVLSIGGFIILLNMAKRESSAYILSASSLGLLTLFLFFAGFFVSSFINQWYVYVDRALLMFPVQLCLPIALGYIAGWIGPIIRRYALVKR